jgi:hypothetical protein
MLVSAHASTVYTVRRINSKTKQILPTVFPTYPKLIQTLQNLTSDEVVYRKVSCSWDERRHAQSYMRRICRNFRGPSVLPKKQRNRAVLFRTRFTPIWRNEIHISVNIDAHVLNRLRHRFLLRCTLHHICPGQ